MYLSIPQLTSALSLRDLSDPAQGEHAMQTLLTDVVNALTGTWTIPATVHRTTPLVATADNYDRLGYAPDDVTRDARYSRHASPTVMLRSHTSAGIPAVLDSLASVQDAYDQLHVLPGLVYRRDAVDRTHVGAPHQVDLWRIKARGLLTDGDLHNLAGAVVEAVLPGARWRAVPANHSYTSHGMQIDVETPAGWLELAECGLVGARILRGSGLDARRWSGLALGMGLDRALMLRKGIDDIRLLRSPDPRIASQMLDLEPWRPVSLMPAVRRDLSILCGPDADEETLGDVAREALGGDAEVLESLVIRTRTPVEQLPSAAYLRLQAQQGQENLLVRLTLQALDRTLTDAEANALRDHVYVALHEGPVLELTG
ncbi:phenylalanyl-tRNA synthetase alpha chain [Arthrobacter pigmenti]|uniref:Phenylalanyl-tRNA synthetase alpha chain n=1 Tax=Arthrobacter pigmenti TaxID=271432 RepID=A0A846RS87_9MICC|nr:hypothetical protein [Arthrobacter pigmenti]NJC23412.1 phenylalanyl-tRNA synthetase alpha chain [Arthrobacter pigmenti]